MSATPVMACVALGANLGDAVATVQQALRDVAGLPDTQLFKASSLYRSAPVDSTGADYINAVVQLRTSMLGVDHETSQLSHAVRSLNDHSSGALSEVEAQQLQISQIAAAATQLAATSQGVARSCEQASDSAQQTRRIAADSSRDRLREDWPAWCSRAIRLRRLWISRAFQLLICCFSQYARTLFKSRR